MSDSYNINYDTIKGIRDLHNITSPISASNKSRNSISINRFRVRYPGEMLDNAFGYVFFTKPELNIFEDGSYGTKVNSEIASIPDFNLLLRTDPELFVNLQANQGYGNFILPLTNMVRNFPTKDVVIKTRESAETADDWKVIYASRKNDSISSDTVDLSFLDDRNLTTYKTLKIWVEYMHNVSVGNIKPKKKHIRKRCLDYACSIYFFLTDETATNIKYWCKLIGAFPTNIPSSAFSWEIGNFKQTEYSVTFQYFAKDESPNVLTDFNKVSEASGTFRQTWTDQGIAPTTWSDGVFIETGTDNIPRLRFK